ncbi:hypothetical protein HmCmsJML164_00428 [Escherichia coli]|nr:hypothetical protein HmCmsJML164_00428 [Escherichia coli]
MLKAGTAYPSDWAFFSMFLLEMMYIAAPVICRSPYKMKKENLHFHFESKLAQKKRKKA